ncbi:MAG: lipocalin family protein [Elusimicrobia bacterium]|nr:lipocalin family protein [Elusimicrobiota bacterium]
MTRILAILGSGLAVVSAFLCGACATHPVFDSQPMPQVDLSRYMGRWHEIVRYPHSFERGCRNVTADYALLPGGKVAVLNACEKGTPPKAKTASAKAWSIHPTNSRLKVCFFWPFKGDYWIVGLDPEYRWAMVGSPRKDYFWILSRSPRLDPALEATLFEEARRLGYDPAGFERP